MFYEFTHPATTDYFMKSTGKNYEFPAHIQECFELLIVTDGELNLTIDKEKVSLKKGQSALIFPNVVHSMLPNKSEFMICIFSPLLVSAYYSKIKNSLPDNCVFNLPDHLFDLLKNMEKKSTTLSKKGVLYLLCDYFDQGRTYSKQKFEQNNLLVKIFRYIENNYKEECELKALSRNLGYDYTYISRFFKNSVGISFNNYLNLYRLNNVCWLFENTTQSITSCAFESGYTSLRTFDRNFKKNFGVTPREYSNKVNRK